MTVRDGAIDIQRDTETDRRGQGARKGGRVRGKRGIVTIGLKIHAP